MFSECKYLFKDRSPIHIRVPTHHRTPCTRQNAARRSLTQRTAWSIKLQCCLQVRELCWNMISKLDTVEANLPRVDRAFKFNYLINSVLDTASSILFSSKLVVPVLFEIMKLAQGQTSHRQTIRLFRTMCSHSKWWIYIFIFIQLNGSWRIPNKSDEGYRDPSMIFNQPLRTMDVRSGCGRIAGLIFP